MSAFLPLNDGQVEKSSFHGRYQFGTWEVKLGHSKVVVSWLLSCALFKHPMTS